jgi:acetylornithine deacetylase
MFFSVDVGSMPQRYSPEALTAKLVSFDTVSDRSNLPLVDFVSAYLAGYGVEGIRLPDASGE